MDSRRVGGVYVLLCIWKRHKLGELSGGAGVREVHAHAEPEEGLLLLLLQGQLVLQDLPGEGTRSKVRTAIYSNSFLKNK